VAAGPEASQLVWFDREGTELGRVGEPADYGDVSLSPDGMRVAVSVREGGSDTADIWVFEFASGMGTRVTSDPADDIAPVWSPDGRLILFASSRSGSYDVYQKAASRAGNEVAIIDDEGDQIAYDWSSNGRYLVYQTNQPGAVAGGNLDLWARPLPGGRPFASLRTVHAASRATFSPDGSWVAYTSLEGGRDDVYVARFPRYDGRRRISARGGSWSRWRRDGSEIFYLDPENRVMAVPVTRTGSDFDAGPARPLFQIRAEPNRGYAYDVSPDGQRILVNTPR
jgi:Tol biopolymer transport system component